MVAHTCILALWRTEAEGSTVEAGLHRERPCLKMTPFPPKVEQKTIRIKDVNMLLFHLGGEQAS